MGVEVGDTVAHLRRLEQERAARGRQRLAAIERLLPVAAGILRERGAARVYAFGSVASGLTGPTSDLDLAVEGLPAERYFDALGALMRALPCDVDLVRLEEAPESLGERILAEGRAL
jgi:predicted nucleotidyltransferase